MGRPLELVQSEFSSASSSLSHSAQELQDGLSQVDLIVSQLLASNWKGDAASAFQKVWDQWHGGAGQVVRGLQTMSSLLSVAGNEYGNTDQQGGAAISSSMQGGGSASGGSQAAAPAPAATSPAGGTGASSSAGAGASGLASQLPSLAEQMMGSLGQAAQPLSQIGQMAAGLAQTGAQIATAAAQAAQTGQDAKDKPEKDADKDSTEAKDQDIDRKSKHEDGAAGPGDPSTQRPPVPTSASDAEHRHENRRA
ncbi:MULTISPECIES: WXG100 family type VII secretion target [unclassified Mycolicibacterium]|uniref:WXG100 family type VII secretion target n=1 Tax=unclassified Mycolicibacterium TaxID=2636767 RepID=UPI001390C20D|nr:MULTISPECIES: WXG100 family type VII secretion target [unclassified Mycolicibacterium]